VAAALDKEGQRGAQQQGVGGPQVCADEDGVNATQQAEFDTGRWTRIPFCMPCCGDDGCSGARLLFWMHRYMQGDVPMLETCSTDIAAQHVSKLHDRRPTLAFPSRLSISNKHKPGTINGAPEHIQTQMCLP